MGEQTGADLVARELSSHDVRVVFSLNGGHIAPLFRAFSDRGIKIIDVRHEDAAVHMAQAFERLGGGIGIACVTAGPGVTNCITAVATAWAGASPLLLIGGRVPVPQWHLGALQDVDQTGILRPIVRSARTVLDAGRCGEYTAEAIRLAHIPPHRPTYLEIPTDVLRESVPNAGDPDTASSVSVQSTAVRPPPQSDVLEQAVRKIEANGRVAMAVGSGVRWSGAFGALRACAEELQAPVLTTSLARGALPVDHPLNLFAARSFILSSAEVVLLVGARLNYVWNYGRPPRFSRETEIIHIDLSPSELGRRGVARVAIQGDAERTLERITDLVDETRQADQGWVDQCRKRHRRNQRRLQSQVDVSAKPIHPGKLCLEAASAAPEDAIYVADGGDILSFARLLLHPRFPNSYIDPGPYGALGCGLPFANGAAVAHPDRSVLCITGDGALGLNLMEFDTAVRHNLNVTVVVSNNAAWGIERNSQVLDFGDASGVGTLLRDARFDRIAEALGGKGERVTESDQLGDALRWALEVAGPSLVDVVTDVDAASPDVLRGLARVPDGQPLDILTREASRNG